MSLTSKIERIIGSDLAEKLEQVLGEYNGFDLSDSGYSIEKTALPYIDVLCDLRDGCLHFAELPKFTETNIKTYKSRIKNTEKYSQTKEEVLSDIDVDGDKVISGLNARNFYHNLLPYLTPSKPTFDTT